MSRILDRLPPVSELRGWLDDAARVAGQEIDIQPGDAGYSAFVQARRCMDLLHAILPKLRRSETQERGHT